MPNPDPFPWFDFVFGWLFFLSFVCFGFCLTTLRQHADARTRESADDGDAGLESAIPSREILTKSGVKRYNLAIVSLLVAMGTAALMIARNLLN